MNPNEWFVIFIHEHLHALDKTLIDSLEIYGDEGLTQTLKTYKKELYQHYLKAPVSKNVNLFFAGFFL
jgi:hypothetical protein